MKRYHPPKKPALRDIVTRNALALQWLDLVPWALYEKRPPLFWVTRILGWQDALQEGRLILLRAAELWEPSKGTFATYATKCVRCRLKGLALKQRSRTPPTAPEPLDLDLFAGHGAEALTERVEALQLGEAIAFALRFLTPRERDIVSLRYGLQGRAACTLSEVSRLLGVTKECVRQLEKKALRKLAKHSHGKKLADFLGLAACLTCDGWTAEPVVCSDCKRSGCRDCVPAHRRKQCILCYNKEQRGEAKRRQAEEEAARAAEFRQDFFAGDLWRGRLA